MKLYTFGYQGVSVVEFDRLLSSLGGVVADVRKMPWSKDESWTKHRLINYFGRRYVHVPEFGNVNYKTGGPVVLVNPIVGVERVSRWLTTMPVVLLCGCWQWSTCHRRDAAELVAEKLGCEVVHLTRQDVPKVPPDQMSLLE